MKPFFVHNRFRILIFFLILTCYNFQCRECDVSYIGRTSYFSSVNPLQEVYRVGDAIEIATKISALIPLVHANELYDFGGEALSFVVQVFEVNPDNATVSDGLEDFYLEAKDGQIVHSPFFERRLAKEIVSECGSDSCGFRLALIPKSQGYFGLNLLSSNSALGECVDMQLTGNAFLSSNNQFYLCGEIGTTQLRIQEGGPYYAHPQNDQNFYFFKVE